MKAKLFILTLVIAGLLSGCGGKESSTTPAKDTTAVVAKAPDYKKMIVAKVFIKPGKVKDFTEAAKVMIENSNKEPGCEGYMLYQDPYDNTKLVFVETYKNQAAVDAHFAAQYFKDFGPKITDLVAQPTQIFIYDIAGEVKK